MSDSASELLSNMKSTAASRFNASKRLEARDLNLTRLTAFSSAYVVGLTVLPYFIHLPPGGGDRINLLTLILAVVILVASLIQYSARDGVNAEQHYRCGLEIGEMRRRLKIQSATISESDLIKFANDYALVLQKYSINHDQVDYDQYRIERYDERIKLSYFDRVKIPLRIAFNQHLSTISLVVISIALIALIIAIVGPEWRLAAPAVNG